MMAKKIANKIDHNAIDMLSVGGGGAGLTPHIWCSTDVRPE